MTHNMVPVLRLAAQMPKPMGMNTEKSPAAAAAVDAVVAGVLAPAIIRK